MSLTKLLDMLMTSTLFFSQANLLRQVDPFEGSLPRQNLAFYESLSEDPELMRNFLGQSDDNTIKYIRDIFAVDAIKKRKKIWPNITYINCWHMNEYESAFLWSIYAPYGEGVAVKSSISSFRASIEQEPKQIIVGAVDYIDFEKDFINERNNIIPFFRKRKSFEAEKELRACLTFLNELTPDGLASKNPVGIKVSCDVQKLIDVVFVSPTAPLWHRQTVEELCQRLGYDITVCQSDLAGPAIL